MLQMTFLMPNLKGESHLQKLQCITLDVTSQHTPTHCQWGSHTHPNSNALLQMLQTTFIIPMIYRGVTHPNFSA